MKLASASVALVATLTTPAAAQLTIGTGGQDFHSVETVYRPIGGGAGGGGGATRRARTASSSRGDRRGGHRVVRGDDASQGTAAGVLTNDAPVHVAAPSA